MSDTQFKKFEIPQKLLDQLYELTGGSDSYKGFIIAYSTENGEPIIYNRCDTQVTEYGLHKALETYLQESQEQLYQLTEDAE